MRLPPLLPQPPPPPQPPLMMRTRMRQHRAEPVAEELQDLLDVRTGAS